MFLDEGNHCAVVRERLRVLSWAIEKMREGTPEGRGGGKPMNPSIGGFAKEHDAMLTALILAVGPFVKPLELDIPESVYRAPGCATLVCRWTRGNEK